MGTSNIATIPRVTARGEAEHPTHDCEGESAERLAIRHHLDTLILKLAAAQAGSPAAVRESRTHALAALAILDRPDDVACEHARVSGLTESSREWMCEGCGAHWPKRTAARHRPATALRATVQPTRRAQPRASLHGDDGLHPEHGV